MASGLKDRQKDTLIGRKAMVYGMGREINGDGTHYVRGEEAEAKLVKPIGGPDSDVWFVLFNGDPNTRCRRIARLL